MKKHLLFLTALIILLISLEASAQTSKGKFLLGGFTHLTQPGSSYTSANIGYSTIKSKDDSGDDDDYQDIIFSLNFAPKAGYFLIDNLALGVDFNLTSSFNKTTNTEYKSRTTIISAGPFVRYYIPTKKVLPFAEAMYSFGSAISSSEWEEDETSVKYSVQLYSLGIGVAIPFGEKVSFDALVGYHSTTYKAKEDNENNRRDIAGTVGLKLGFTIFLGSTE